MPLALLLTIALSQSPSPLIRCASGKTGEVEIFVSPDGTLSSRDRAVPEAERIFSGRLIRARRIRRDRAHDAIRFEIAGGALRQPKDLDARHCRGAGARAICPFDALLVPIPRGPVTSPGDERMAVLRGREAIVMDNAGPTGCEVIPGPALRRFLGR